MNRIIKSALSFGTCWLLCFSNTLSGESFFTKEETLFSSRTGKPLANLILSVSSQPDNPGEYVLNISNTQSSNIQSIWIFEQRTSAELLKKSDPSIEVQNINEFSAFCGSREVRFELTKWRKITTSLKVPFSTTVSEGKDIKLRLYFYAASQKKKKTIIEDEAFIGLEFTLSSQAGKENEKSNENSSTTLRVDTSLGSARVLTPEEIEEKARQREDSIKQVEIQELNSFISKKNEEIDALLLSTYKLTDSKRTIGKGTVDSLETIANQLKEEVDFQKSGAGNLIPKEKGLMQQFVSFSTKHTEALKKIGELRKKEPNWLIYIGAGMGILLLGGMLFMQIWNPIKLKRQQKKQQQEQQRLLEEQEKQRVLAGIDINDLDEI